jgi:hypothetical protein
MDFASIDGHRSMRCDWNKLGLVHPDWRIAIGDRSLLRLTLSLCCSDGLIAYPILPPGWVMVH